MSFSFVRCLVSTRCWPVLFWLLPLLSGNAAVSLGTEPQSLSSLQSYTGLWDMPNARVLPDWNMRFKVDDSGLYRFYGGALGLFDRLEIQGQISRANTSGPIFGTGVDYGNFKDRSAGAKLVLKKEDGLWPQLAIGLYDPLGTGVFRQRYVVASKLLGSLDLSLGLGQGMLAGGDLAFLENKPPTLGEFGFVTASPFQKTALFGGAELHLTPNLTLSAEYSSLDYENLKFGEEAEIPVNVGLKYKLFDFLRLHAGYSRGEDLMWGVNFQMPLEPYGPRGWSAEQDYQADEWIRWEAYEADNAYLSRLIGKELVIDGFDVKQVSCGINGLWIQAYNAKYLSNARAFGRIARIVDAVAPERITRIYINLMSQGQIRQSLAVSRANLRAFLDRRMDKQGFLGFADFDLYGSDHWQEFFAGSFSTYEPTSSKWRLQLRPQLKTLIEDPADFFLHKLVMQANFFYYPWENGQFITSVEQTLFNEMDQALNAEPLEDDPARTGWLAYETESRTRLTTGVFDQTFPLPWDVWGRMSLGYLETQFAGLSWECFRYFHDGLWGMGLQGEVMRKRDPVNSFTLSDESDKIFDTFYLNLYSQIWPSQGLEAGVKLGQFLGGDRGAKFEIRRSFKYFTIGGYFTMTRGGDFDNPLNIGNSQKGIYISIPMSIFSNKERTGHLTYGMGSFLRDAGQETRLPNTLYPINPWSTTTHTRQHLGEMR